MPYFRRAGHVGLLVGASLFTYGFGGLVYWLARRKHLVCPRCGLGWENASRALAVTGPEPERCLIEQEPDEKLVSKARRIAESVGLPLETRLVGLGELEQRLVDAVEGGPER